MKFQNPPGATPLNDTEGLIPKHITTQEELNEYEQNNILKATRKLMISRYRKKEWLNIQLIKHVHKEMFSETWEWAGEFRKIETNMGLPPYQISSEIKKLCDDINVWPIEPEKQVIENAVKLHHRLTHIHPFKNGNGRHARLMANLYLYNHHLSLLPWGACPLNKKDATRKKYLIALKEADKGEFNKLIQFAKSEFREKSRV
ncbi:MAG: mobile mystery protein B [Deltaproteobacteria bacterium]|nr:mobile mystery protein B [Deltaproteobacteria bacterium]